MGKGSVKVAGVLLNWFIGSYQGELIRGIEEEAKKRGITVLYFPGRELDASTNYAKLYNRIYDLINNKIIDGLIVPVSVIEVFQEQKILQYLEKFAPIPIIALSFDYKNGYSIKIDNQAGLKNLMEHLVHEHGFTKYSFVHGPENHPDAMVRYQVFQEVLAANNIPYDDNTLYFGDFTITSGLKYVNTFLKEKKLKPKEDIEVIVCANDLMAMGVIQELEKEGYKIPEDVAVTGFDDIEESRQRLIPLTTVRHPIREMGREGVKAFDLNAEPETLLPTVFLQRATCGCTSYDAHKSLFAGNTGKFNTKEALVKEVSKILFPSGISTKITNQDRTGIEKIIEFFLQPHQENNAQEVKSNIYSFFLSWIQTKGGLDNWTKAIFFLENTLPPAEKKEKRCEILQYTQLIISDLTRQSELAKNSGAYYLENRLGWVGSALKASTQLDDLSIPLSRRLKEWLGIYDCYICLYTHPSDFAHDFKMLNTINHQEKEGLKIYKDSGAIFERILQRDKPGSYVIQALVLDLDSMGFCIFDYHEKLNTSYYERLRLNISTVLNLSLTMIESERRSKELKMLQEKLIQSAHQAGMAQIAINLMHTIGNILNSANITIEEAKNRIKKSVIHRFHKANQLLVSNKENWHQFLYDDNRGKMLLEYYLKLENMLEDENAGMLTDIQKLEKRIEDITKVVNAQKELSEGIFISESINLVETLERGIFLKNEILQESGIELIRQYSATEKFFISCFSNKLLHIVVKIIEFAIYGALKSSDKLITINLTGEDSRVLLTISNTGGGLDKESQKKLFQQNFNLPSNVPGKPSSGDRNVDFHFIANSLTEIGASIKAESCGPGKGTTILISFPLPGKEKNTAEN